MFNVYAACRNVFTAVARANEVRGHKPKVRVALKFDLQTLYGYK